MGEAAFASMDTGVRVGELRPDLPGLCALPGPGVELALLLLAGLVGVGGPGDLSSALACACAWTWATGLPVALFDGEMLSCMPLREDSPLLLFSPELGEEAML